jgi:tRNA acetyltransferase TAN1
MGSPQNPAEKQQKRRRNENQGSWQRKNRQRFGRASGSEVRRDLAHGSRGFLVTCDPKHEQQCFREALVILGEQIELLVPDLASAFASSPAENAHPTTTAGPALAQHSNLAEAGDDGEKAEPTGVSAEAASSISDALAAEVHALRVPQKHVFTRIDWGMQGSVFLRVTDDAIRVEKVVEAVLRNARKNRTPSSRNCVRFIPVHSTCYAKPDDAARAAAKVVSNYDFGSGKLSYSIVYRSRMNSDAHREDFIKAIAASIDVAAPGRFKVNLDRPDFVIIVEVARTTCCIGIFQQFYELAKLNIREVSKPEDPEEEKEQAIPSAKHVLPREDENSGAQEELPSGGETKVESG